MKIPVLILIIFLLASCKKESPTLEQINNAELPKKTRSANFIPQKKIKKDTITPYSTDSIVINKRKILIMWNEDNAYIINSTKDTIYTLQESGLNFPKLIDYNEDGYSDIIFSFYANNPTHELALYDVKTNTFKKVENYVAYSGAVKIKGTKYYYSYHRSGCADSNWDSDLIYIENFKAHRIGNIKGIGCKGEKKNGIFIYKIKDDEKTLVQSILRKPGFYYDKWDFIHSYWTKNCKRFE